jgi:aspartate ammonia-lyase
MSPSAVRDRLRQTQFLEGLTDSALHQLSKLVTPVTYECDDILFEEGSARTFIVIIITGAIAVEKGQNGRPVRLVTLGAGQSVGEGLLLDDTLHGTSARAVQKTEGYLLNSAQVAEMVKEYPTLYAAHWTCRPVHLAAIGGDGRHTCRTWAHTRLRRRGRARA